MFDRSSLRSVRNRRTSLAVQAVFAYMSMPTLLAWRSASLDNYMTVNQHLRNSLHALIGRFFPDPVAFLQMLAPWGALIVGEAALSHILHQPTVCETTFELAIGNLYFQPFLDCLSRILSYDTHISSLLVKPAPDGFPFHRHITRIAECRLASGLFVVLYESSSPSACDVVSGYWTTALMNFVTGFTLGCAYPRLTFNQLTLECDSRTASLAWWDYAMASRLKRLRFNTDVRCENWPLSARGPSSSYQPIVDACGKSMYVCPLQGRYFGDLGSLVLFYDGFCVDLGELRDLGVAPFGPMVAWRMPCTGTCKGGCVEKDPVLPPFVISMLTQFADDTSTFARAHEVLHTIYEARSRNPVISPPPARRGRRYSV
ncbi:hypothetical protein LXA43DRAFT_1099318 [Ganoderma leucocontextum]|nr:hypothetical protein LXA43DRAFT_1099318 [Ganoderma leucocontextum]